MSESLSLCWVYAVFHSQTQDPLQTFQQDYISAQFQKNLLQQRILKNDKRCINTSCELKIVEVNKHDTRLWSPAVSGGFPQAGLLQSSWTVTISALPKLTIHWHEDRENGYMEWHLTNATHCSAVVGLRKGCSGWQTNMTWKLQDYTVSATLF